MQPNLAATVCNGGSLERDPPRDKSANQTFKWYLYLMLGHNKLRQPGKAIKSNWRQATVAFEPLEHRSGMGWARNRDRHKDRDRDTSNGSVTCCHLSCFFGCQGDGGGTNSQASHKNHHTLSPRCCLLIAGNKSQSQSIEDPSFMAWLCDDRRLFVSL